jgi:hypothetical protein
LCRCTNCPRVSLPPAAEGSASSPSCPLSLAFEAEAEAAKAAAGAAGAEGASVLAIEDGDASACSFGSSVAAPFFPFAPLSLSSLSAAAARAAAAARLTKALRPIRIEQGQEETRRKEEGESERDSERLVSVSRMISHFLSSPKPLFHPLSTASEWRSSMPSRMP